MRSRDNFFMKDKIDAYTNTDSLNLIKNHDVIQLKFLHNIESFGWDGWDLKPLLIKIYMNIYIHSHSPISNTIILFGNLFSLMFDVFLTGLGLV
jgi:hypothetical protein